MPDQAPAVPAAPAIPVGLGTFVGLGTGAGQWVAAIIAALNGDHTATTITLIVTGAATVITTLIGRYQQAKAQIHTAAYATQFAAPVSSDDDRVGHDELEIGQTDPDSDVPVHDGDVPPDEGDVGGKSPEVQA